MSSHNENVPDDRNELEESPELSPDASQHVATPDYPEGLTAKEQEMRGLKKGERRVAGGRGNNANARQDNNWRLSSASGNGSGSGSFTHPSQGPMAKHGMRAANDNRFIRNSHDPIPNHAQRANPKSLNRKPKECPQTHDLILCMPLSIPDGKIRVTKDAGDNFYDFPDENLNSQLLFSNTKGVCDVWASFLQVRLGMVHNVATQDIVRVVEGFNDIMSETGSEWGGPTEPLGAIEMQCVGLFETALPDISQDYTGTKHPATFCETHGKLQDAGKEVLKKIRRKIKRFALSLTLEFNLPMANVHFPLRMEHIKNSQKEAIADALDVKEIPSAGLRDDSMRILLHAMSTGQLPKKIPEPIRTRILERCTWPDTEPDAPDWAQVAAVRRGSIEGVMKIDLQDFIRDAEKDLRVLIREWSELSEPELITILRCANNKESIVVPRVFMGEVRMEHTTKKMMDPRWKGGFVLTRQMAGEEDPRVWAEADAAGRPRVQSKSPPESAGPVSPRIDTSRYREFRARYIFGETPLPECIEPPPAILEAFIRRWKKVFTRSLPNIT